MPVAVTPQVSATVTPPEAPLRKLVFSGATMGTRYAATCFAPEGTDTTKIAAALDAVVTSVDRQMSNWKPESDLNRLNAAAPGTAVALPQDLLHVLALGQEISAASGGAFSLETGDLVEAWGFGPAQGVVDQAAAQRLAASDDPGGLELDPTRGTATRQGACRIDLSGIAKGFGVDRMAAALEQFGITRYLVSIDGELRSRGLKPGGAPWQVAIERPDFEVRDVARVVALRDGGIATSGDYRHRMRVGDRTVSHTMDPRTRRPVDNRIASVTVAAPTCATADAWATALLVLGEVEGPKLADRLGLDALFILRGAEGLEAIEVGEI